MSCNKQVAKLFLGASIELRNYKTGFFEIPKIYSKTSKAQRLNSLVFTERSGVKIQCSDLLYISFIILRNGLNMVRLEFQCSNFSFYY